MVLGLKYYSDTDNGLSHSVNSCHCCVTGQSLNIFHDLVFRRGARAASETEIRQEELSLETHHHLSEISSETLIRVECVTDQRGEEEQLV